MQSTPKPPIAPSVVVVTPDELAELVRAAVREELGARGAPANAAPLVSKQTLAAQLGISVAGVDRLAARGEIPFVRVGDVRRFDVAAVRAALEQAPATPVASQPSSAPRLLSRGSR